jgi:DNA-binding NarL/FixJ family response regulator
MGSKRSGDGGRPRVVLADDHREMLVRVKALLASEFTVVGAVGDGETLLDAEADLRPDVLVIDITMPGISGLEAAALVRRRGSQVPIVFLSVHEEPEFVLAARQAGALGYVSKVRLASDLIPAVRAALDGRRFVSASVNVEADEAL